MEYKVGDKLLCKKDFISYINNYITMFDKGSYYDIITTTDDQFPDLKRNFKAVYVEGTNGGYWFNIKGGLSTQNFDQYFYTKEEERKLKLKKLC